MTHERDVPLDVLGDRYPSTAMVAIWSRKRKTVLMRRLWIADLVIKESLGVRVPAGAIDAYTRVKDHIDLDSIARREAKVRHDVLAQVHEFNALAGFECIHQSYTSRDETDNLEQLQILESCLLARDHIVAVLRRFGDLARQYETLDTCARTHYVPAQVTTLGKRFATFAEVTLTHFRDLESFIANYAMRGIKGPVGTQSDMIRILGSVEKAQEYEDRICEELGFESVFISTGQVYDRSFDLKVVNTLKELSAGRRDFRKTVA